MPTRNKSNLFTIFHGGRSTETLIGLFLLVASYIALIFAMDDWAPVAEFNHILVLVAMAMLASNSLPLVNYQVPPTRWLASGVLNILLISVIMTAAAWFCIVVKPHFSELPTYTLDSYLVNLNTINEAGFQHLGADRFPRVFYVVLSSLMFFMIHCALGFSGMAIGAIHRTAGIRGAIATIAVGIAASIGTGILVDHFVYPQSIPAPWPGVIIFSFPPVVVGGIVAYYAASKQAK